MIKKIISKLNKIYNGRLTRGQYLVGILLLTLIMFTIILVSILFVKNTEVVLPYLMILLVPALFISYGLGARRIHDLGGSGWLILFSHIPPISALLFIAVVFLPGDPKENTYGVRTPTPTFKEKIKIIINQNSIENNKEKFLPLVCLFLLIVGFIWITTIL